MRVIIFGIDGGTWTLLRPAMDGGYMPFLQSVVDRGMSGTLRSTLPAITPAAWSTFLTGRDPSETGVFDFSYLDKKTRTLQLVNGGMLSDTIFDIASREGLSVGALNVPMTYPPRAVNGRVVSGLMTPSMQTAFTHPNCLKNELLSEFPDYDVLNLGAMYQLSPHEDTSSFIEAMATMVEMRAEAANWMQRDYTCDLFMVHFQASDVLQHALWWYTDPSHPDYDSALRAHVFERFYGSLDRSIRDVLERFAERGQEPVTAMVVSDHGFQAHSKRFNLGNWLRDHGHLVPIRTKRTAAVLSLLRQADVLNARKLFGPLRRRRIGHAVMSLSGESPMGIDWERSEAVSVGRSNEGFIYVLHEEGSSAFERLNSELEKALGELRDPVDGCRVVDKVHRNRDTYEGEKRTNLPDLIIEPAPGYSFTGACQQEAHLVHTVTPGIDLQLGKHHPDGVFILAGPETAPARDLHADMVDVAPTVLSLLGLAPTRDMGGTPLSGEPTQHKSANTCLPRREEPAPSQVYSDKERRQIEERLRDLGYR